MHWSDPVARALERECMVARIATVSGEGRPSVTPLYFVLHDDHVWLGTATWTLAARHIAAGSRVSVLLAPEGAARAAVAVRLTGTATVRTERRVMWHYVLGVALKYSLTGGQLRNTLGHLHLVRLRRRYHRQSAAKGQGCVIDVAPERIELVRDPMAG